MRISFQRSGGFAGLPGAKQSLDFDTSAAASDELPVARARELERLVEEAQLFNQPPKNSPAANPVRDGYQYDLRLEDGGRSHVFTVHDGAIAPSLEPLINWLNKELAAKLKRSLAERQPPNK